jgi:hypothetical protein
LNNGRKRMERTNEDRDGKSRRRAVEKDSLPLPQGKVKGGGFLSELELVKGVEPVEAGGDGEGADSGDVADGVDSALRFAAEEVEEVEPEVRW